MTKNLSFLFLLSAQFICAQDQPIKLDHTDPSASKEDLNRIDEYIENKKLIGIGESTHGTHEFFSMRHRLIQYLAENHGLNTVFMEADFANSLLINEYIKGKGGSAEEAVKNLALWPWVTEEVVVFVEWMKKYNKTNPSKSIEFIGVDVQKIDESVARLELLIKNYDLPAREKEVINSSDFFSLNKKEILNLRTAELTRYEKVDISNFSKEDQFEYKWLFRHLDQILGEKLVKKSTRTTYRDKMMAENILAHMKRDEKIKGAFWGHNFHISCIYNEKKETGAAGGYIKKAIGNDYFSLAQEFDYGSFNARLKPNEGAEDPMNWKLGAAKVREAPEGSLASNYRYINHPIIFIPFESLPKEEEVNINFIGAAYSTNKNGEDSDYTRKNHHGRDAFDGMVLIKESSPTKLLKSDEDED